MKNNKILTLLTLCVAAPAVLGGCTPTVTERGNMLKDYQLQQIEAGKHVRSDVLKILGSPTTQAPFDENIWYYMGQETEKRGILDPQITKERVIVVAFGDDGTVETVRELPPGSGLDVPVERSKTATKGNEFTIMQQFLGNIGKFNNAGSSATRTAGGI